MRERNTRGLALWLVPAFASILVAGEVTWAGRPVQSWTEDDARQLLADSPWSKLTIGSIRRLETEDERRSGGEMGQEKGVGYTGIDGKTSRKTTLNNFFTAGPGGKSPPRQDVKLQLRWETALPVRAAELKAGVIEPPVTPGYAYSLAVYGVPGDSFTGDPKKLGAPLKADAVLKREGKADLRPSSVEVFQREDGLVVVYLFSASAEISVRDGVMEFDAHIGRLGFTQYFDAGQMQFQGRLEI